MGGVIACVMQYGRIYRKTIYIIMVQLVIIAMSGFFAVGFMQFKRFIDELVSMDH